MKLYIIFIFSIFSFSICAQDMKDYTANWEGKIKNKNAFNLNVTIDNLENGKSTFTISNEKTILSKRFNFNNTIECILNEKLKFSGMLSEDKSEINGFIKSGMLFYHIKLKKRKDKFKGIWNILMVDTLANKTLYLSVENGAKNKYQAYPIFGDNRFTGTWCANFKKNKDTISFSDYKTGLKFVGILKSSKIKLDINIGTSKITQVSLKKSIKDWKIGIDSSNINKPSNNEWKVSNKRLLLPKMEDAIKNKVLSKTESVVISKKGKIIYENYFSGFNASISHDTRSLSKSISSAIVGIAFGKKIIQDLNDGIYNYLPQKYQETKDSLKSKITIKSLLTMSSGIDAIDYGIGSNRKSPAIEDNYQMNMKDWTKPILEAPMIHEPFTHANYGSANPHLLGVILNSVVKEPLELFIDKNLFLPLEISNYVIQSDISGQPYFGGGMYLTSRDLLKFGQLYLNKGKWNNNRILSKKWVENSFLNYLNLENTRDKNGYGFLWWHHTYTIAGKIIKTIEARGAGGQYIFIVPNLKVVAVITSGNYRNNKTKQPEIILEKYILPKLCK